MRYLITVDSGTTNTRASLWTEAGDCLDTRRAGAGVRDTALEGHNTRLQKAVRECIDTLLIKNGLTLSQIGAVYASGMITSELGLAEVPHLTPPAGPRDFARGVETRLLPEVCGLPIHFVPGLKNLGGDVDPENLEAMDIMRGEETEATALAAWLPPGEEYLLALPGSHTKFISVDRKGRLLGCLTSLAGELLSALTEHTILSDAVEHRFVGEDYRREMVSLGFRTARDTSLSRAAFSTRILRLYGKGGPADCANFLLGAVLENDLSAVKSSKALRASPDMRVVVAGKDPLRAALADVFRLDGYFCGVSAFHPPRDVPLSGYGAYLLAKINGDL